MGTQKPSFHLAPLMPSWWGHSDLVGRREQGHKGERAQGWEDERV